MKLSYVGNILAHFLLLVLISLFSSSHALAGKKRCQPLKDKLQSIQSQQRQANTVKKSNQLKIKESNAYKKWRMCEQGKFNKAKTDKERKHNAIKVKTSVQEDKFASKAKRHVSAKQSTAPFKTSKALHLKNEYQGSKQVAWLAFYQQPIKCRYPKSTQEFAFCSEDRQKQRQQFEKSYLTK